MKDLFVGHLLLLCQIGSMPHDLAMYNIERIATDVVPNLRHLHSEYEDHWWPQPLTDRVQQQPMFAPGGER